MQFLRVLSGMVCASALMIAGCTPADTAKTSSVDKKNAGNGQNTDKSANTDAVKPKTAEPTANGNGKTSPAGAASANSTAAAPTSVEKAKPAPDSAASDTSITEAKPISPNAKLPAPETTVASNDEKKAGDPAAESAKDAKPPAAAEDKPQAEEKKQNEEKQPEEKEEEKLPELTVGSAAPVLKNATWIKGDAIEKFEPGQVYVVEFWATWCGPCLHSMPHISKLQTEYGDKVKFIGVSIDNEEELVRKFMDEEQEPKKLWKDVITYTIAFDKNQQINKDYMEAAAQQGIPTAFIVGRDGKIDWIGHPMSIDDPISQVSADKWDRAAALAAIVEEQKAAREEQAKQRKLQAAMNVVGKAVEAKDFDLALKTIEELIVENPKIPQLRGFKLHVLKLSGKKDEAHTLMQELVKEQWDNPQILFQMAPQSTASSEGGEARDFELALKAAGRVNEMVEGNAMIQGLIAKLHHQKGDIDAAIEWQKKAVTASDDNPDVTKQLQEYKEEKAKGSTAKPADDKKEGDEKKAESAKEKKAEPADAKKE